MTNDIDNENMLRPNANRTINTTFLKIDLPFFIAEIKREKTWLEGDRNAITLLKNTLMRIVLIALRKGAALKKHQAAGAISIQVIEGKMTFTTDTQAVELTRGEMITLHEGIEHSVVAKEETVFLLTITSASN
jgi:quercetin dioxygenase-like cupin family protein